MLTPHDAQAWLHAAFLTRPGFIIRDHQPLKSFQQQMDRLALHWPDTDERADVIVRAYRSSLSWWTLVTPDLPGRERTAWACAQRGGVPIAPLLYHGRVAGQQGAVFAAVPGHAHWTPDSPTLVVHLAETLAHLHTAKLDAAARSHLPVCTLPALLGRLAAWVEEVGSEPLRRDLLRITARLTAVREQPPVLVHGDCHPGNILVGGDRVTAVIDWEEAALGDPRIDLCWLAAAISRDDAALGAVFLAAYQAHTGFATDDLALWSELLEVRYQLARAWIMHALASGRSLPSANPAAWPE